MPRPTSPNPRAPFEERPVEAPPNHAKVLIALATYNEIRTLPALVASIREIAPQANLLIIDDNSPDGTGDWCRQQARADRAIRLISRPGKLGLGSATVDAMRTAIEDAYEFLITMDADFSHDPAYIPQLLERARRSPAQVNVVLGSRYVDGGGVEGWPWRRRLMSKGINWAARAALTLPVSDCSGAFRCYRVAALQELELGKVRASGYAFQEEILWRLRQNGACFAELPIIFRDRAEGKSKLTPREAGRSMAVLVRLGIKNWLHV